MANVRSSDVEFIGAWLCQPLAAEFKRIMKPRKRGSLSDTLEGLVESYVREWYAKKGKPFPPKLEKALVKERERKQSAKWLAKPQKAKSAKRPSS